MTTLSIKVASFNQYPNYYQVCRSLWKSMRTFYKATLLLQMYIIIIIVQSYRKTISRIDFEWACWLQKGAEQQEGFSYVTRLMPD